MCVIYLSKHILYILIFVPTVQSICNVRIVFVLIIHTCIALVSEKQKSMMCSFSDSLLELNRVYVLISPRLIMHVSGIEMTSSSDVQNSVHCA